MFGFTTAFEPLWNLQRAMENAMRNDYFGSATYASASPALNLFKEGENSLVTVELPGVSKQDIQLEVKGKTLRIKAQRKISYPDGASLHRRERASYSLDRSIQLPHEVDEAKVKAELKDGVLALLLPPREELKPKTIKIS